MGKKIKTAPQSLKSLLGVEPERGKVQDTWGRAGVGYLPSLGEKFKITLKLDAHPKPEPILGKLP